VPGQLRAGGHKVWYVAEMNPGLPDTQVLSLCRLHEAILITADKDFGEMVFRRGESHHGIVLLRMPGASPDAKARALTAFVTEHGARIPGAFSVVEPGRWRIRKAT